MSDLGFHGERHAEGAFRRGSILLIIGAGIAAFVAMLVLGAYAPDLRSGNKGGAHALSNAATGFSGLVRLAAATGRNPQLLRSDEALDTEDLVILTPENSLTDMTDMLARRETLVTLLVFPKWDTDADPKKAGWVRVSGLLSKGEPEGVLAPAEKLQFARRRATGEMLGAVPEHAKSLNFPAPPVLQTVSGEGLKPIITDAKGGIVVAQVGDTPLYYLADPDLLNNHGIADPRRAGEALELLDFLNSTGAEGVHFDVTLNGFGGNRSALRLALDPPFLAVTLAIVAAMLLAGLQAMTRFGIPSRPERAIAFGKAALVDNSAALIAKAGREGRMGDRYAEMIRERMAALLRLSPTLPSSEVDQRLDALGGPQDFTTLADGAGQARTREGVLAAARALHDWQQEVRK